MQKGLLVSLLPLITPLTAFAETRNQSELVSPISGTKGNADSWRASQVMGVNVKNASDETIGDVEDLLLDMKTGEILSVVISSGGFLGIDDTLSAVPVSALRYDEAAKAFKTTLTKEQLGQSPQYTSAEWSEHKAQNQDKMRNQGKMNKEDMRRHAATAASQGNSEKDLQITKDIRSGITDTDLSFNAKNIKVITRDEHVSLKGVVKSESEHQAVLKIARNHANTANITDDLTVDSE